MQAKLYLSFWEHDSYDAKNVLFTETWADKTEIIYI